MFAYLNTFKFTDDPRVWESSTNSTETLMVGGENDLKPLRLVSWDEMTSDHAIERWCFSAPAGHTLERIRADAADPDAGPDAEVLSAAFAFKNDWRWMHELAVRDGFEKYGAAAYFSADGKIAAIYVSHTGAMTYPTDGAAWAHAKWAFKCTVLTGLTLREHLSHVHFVSANTLTTALFEELGTAHAIRRLMRPYTYATVSVNLAAFSSLAAKNAIFHRAVALTWDACVTGFRASFEAWAFKTPANDLAARGMGDVPGSLYPCV
jgi:hypothetical protein